MHRPTLLALQRAALLPVLPGAPAAALQAGLDYLSSGDRHAFSHLLIQQGLAPLWHERLEVTATPAPAFLAVPLRRQRLEATASYLVQRGALEEARHALDTAGIRHVTIKGADVRERLYPTPALRPAGDIDLLVAPRDRVDAVKVLCGLGYRLETRAKDISHELSLLRGGTSIDLHWDVLRPGRTRKPLVPAVLTGREDHGGHWGLRPDHALFLMLVHPVFAKYVSTPAASLVRCVDLARWVRRYPDSLQAMPALLDRMGLKTAAWMTCYRYSLLADCAALDSLIAELRPGPARRRYLKQWLRENGSSSLLHRPPLPQLGLTLPAHDTLVDATRALWRWLEGYRGRQQDLLHLDRAVGQ